MKPVADWMKFTDRIDAYNADGMDPYVSPLLHKRLKDLPKVYVAVCGQDTLRDDGRLLKSALDDAGYVFKFALIAHLVEVILLTIPRVPNIYDEYAGYPHWFWAFPSEHLAQPIAEYHRNIEKGFQFVVSSQTKL